MILWAGLLLIGAASDPVAVSPSGATAPENLLRIELVFDRPQAAEGFLDRVALLDENGQAIADAFLDQPLAADEGRRITLLLHPGRVKTGVGLNAAAGPVLARGGEARLTLDGRTVKLWRITAPDHLRPDPARWRVTPPAEPNGPLTVHLDDPVGAAGGASLIAVRDADGRRITGRAALAEGETVWRFTPDAPWTQGRYSVVAHLRLEDPAGNSLCATFETEAGDDRTSCQPPELPFTIERMTP